MQNLKTLIMACSNNRNQRRVERFLTLSDPHRHQRCLQRNEILVELADDVKMEKLSVLADTELVFHNQRTVVDNMHAVRYSQKEVVCIRTHFPE